MRKDGGAGDYSGSTSSTSSSTLYQTLCAQLRTEEYGLALYGVKPPEEPICRYFIFGKLIVLLQLMKNLGGISFVRCYLVLMSEKNL